MNPTAGVALFLAVTPARRPDHAIDIPTVPGGTYVLTPTSASTK